jgi:ribosomal protein L11 methyltransferase
MTATTTTEPQPWATLTLHFRREPAQDPQEISDRSEALAAILAEDPRVSGVETRDPTTLGATSPEPEIILYTAPEALIGLRESAQHLSEELGLHLDATADIRTDDDWRDSWKRFYSPMIFGDGALLLRPSWIPRRPGDPERELVLDPGRAFGTGQHESTRLCMELLVEISARGGVASSPHAALDLGCGSGILALTAALLFPGLGRLVAADNDPEATETAAENAALNPTGPVLEVITGTLEAVPGDFDLMLANIRPSVLIPIAAELVARLRTGGHLILSGILNEEADAVAAPYLAAGLRELRRRSEGEWTALLFARGGAAA